MILPFFTRRLFSIPSSDKYCCVQFRNLSERETSDIRTHPILEYSLNHFLSAIGRGEAPRFIELISPNVLLSHSPENSGNRNTGTFLDCSIMIKRAMKYLIVGKIPLSLHQWLSCPRLKPPTPLPPPLNLSAPLPRRCPHSGVYSGCSHWL